MPFDPETEEFNRNPATIIDSGPGADTVKQGFEDRLEIAVNDIYDDINLLKVDGMIGVGIPATETTRGIGRIATVDEVASSITGENGPAFITPEKMPIRVQNTSLNLTVGIVGLQTMINSLPKILNADVTINVNPGTYAGDIAIKGFQGSGALTVTTGTAISATHNVVRIKIDACSLPRINIIGFNATASSGAGFNAFYSSGRIFFSYCSSTFGTSVTAGNYGFSGHSCGFFYAANCVASNKERGFNIDGGTQASLTSCTGTGNTIGARSSNGNTVHVDINTNLNLTGTTQFSRSGGQFIFASGDIVGTRVWVSEGFQIVKNTAVIATHNLGIDPQKVLADVHLKCLVPEHGYAVGETLIGGAMAMETNNSYYANSPPIPLVKENTIQINSGNGMFGAWRGTSRTNGTNAVITPAGWSIIFRIFY